MPTFWWKIRCSHWCLGAASLRDIAAAHAMICVCACAMHAQIVQHLRFAELIRWKPIFRAAMKMGAYGHPTVKPTMLVSDDPWVFRLDRTGVCVCMCAHGLCCACAGPPQKDFGRNLHLPARGYQKMAGPLSQATRRT